MNQITVFKTSNFLLMASNNVVFKSTFPNKVISMFNKENIAVLKLELLNFQEDEGLKQKFSSHNLPCS
ncbi:hypothetical protein TNCT_624801 [Trichonephila clavata]|uniref:Uncharacterized protein n=1 Tax=Trichonephila clavata TaxID=2740835 RepID=A0A8X6FET1_TRICU|nr:hypothetical protein TNCT_624801 [Trichonephila clavata]